LSTRDADLTLPRSRVDEGAAAGSGPAVRSGPLARPAALVRARRAIGLLVVRDLKVRYASSALGYVWSILEPLLLGLVYWFIFTQIFHREVGLDPYVVFLLAGIFPWTWFAGAVTDTAKSLRNEARLIRSTNVPRELWVLRVVVSKGIEFFFSLPVLLFFVVAYHGEIHWQLVLLLPAAGMMAVLCLGIGLLLAPLTVLLEDLDRIVRLLLRLGFYCSPIIYTVADVPHKLAPFFALNPVAGILELCRAGFFPDQLVWRHVEHSALACLVLLLVGWVVFARLERTVLKEI
jgi:ABC-2 type transport system permease protein